MKIFQKTIKKAYSNWEPCKEIRTYHYAAAFDGNKMIEFAANDPINMNAKAYKLGQQFRIKTFYEYPYLHAESHLVSKLMARYDTVCSNWSFVVLRINREGRILLSKPCKKCQKILDAVGITKIYYSNNNGRFVSPKPARST